MSFQITEIIRKKRGGESLSEAELKFLLKGYLDGKHKDYHLAAWLMAVYFRGMQPEEMRVWARLMWRSGITLARDGRQDFWIDKHSTGGVGDKTSLLLVPLVHSAAVRLWGDGAVKIPMVSGRGLDFTGGTLDKLESVPGFSSQQPLDRALGLLRENGFFMMGQTADLAPADRLLYALRDVTATTDCLPLIVSSILSKKLAENLDGLVFDVKFGSGAFMPEIGKARALAQALASVASAEGVRATAVLTSMNEPLGWKVGHQLEVEECADFLSGAQRERGLTDVTVRLAAEMLVLCSRGQLTSEDACAEVEKEFSRPHSLQAFERMFEAQGGSWEAFQSRRKELEGRPRHAVRALKAGSLARLDALTIAHLVRELGGGRQSKEASVDLDVGVVLHKKVGDSVREGDTLFEVILSAPGEPPLLNPEYFSSVVAEKIPPTRWIEEVLHA